MELTNKGTATIVIFFVAFVAITNIEACNDFKVDRDSYIAGGNEAIPHEFPWMVALEFTFLVEVIQSFDVCAGSIISSKWVVTAAHCFVLYRNGEMKELWHVIAGAHDLSKNEPTVQKMRVDLILMHPAFVGITLPMQNDIALVKILGEFNFDNRTVAPISLPAASDYYAFDCQICVAMGWGLTDEEKPTVLHKANLPTERLLLCQLVFGDLELMEGHFCAGTRYLRERICHGDSGGPLVCIKDDEPVLTAIISFGTNCSVAQNVGVLTRVSTYRKWIDSEVVTVKRRRH